MYSKHKIVIVGAGGIGRAAGLILAETRHFDVELYIGDISQSQADEAVEWISSGASGLVDVFPFVMPSEGSDDKMTEIFKKCAMVLDCLPGSQAPRIAQMARTHELHYANLTEYVKETNEVVKIAEGASTGFVLQTGLAPGFINVLGNKLFQDFCRENKVDRVQKLTMKVGALTRHAEPPHYYGFTWSPVGVATEYLKDAIVIRNGSKRELPALSENNAIIIDGVTYEDNLTSGGAADLPDAFEGKVDQLDYKTLRYPGHYKWVNKIVSNISGGQDRVNELQKAMEQQIPSVEDDVVIVYASVQGFDHQGRLRAIEKNYRIEPVKIGTHTLRAIQATTAAPICEVTRMLLEGHWTGPVFQSQIDAESFLNGPIVSAVYGKWSEEKTAQEQNGEMVVS